MLLELLYFSLLIVKERHFQNASEKQGFTHLFKDTSSGTTRYLCHLVGGAKRD